MTSPGSFHDAARTVRSFAGRHRKHLSAASMVAGFVSDNLLLGRVDLPTTQSILGAYIALAAAAIMLAHVVEARGEPSRLYRWRHLLPMAIQFALGSVWSGLLVFYARSAVFAASWPYLLLLFAIFIGNEVLSRYVSRLVFATTLLFFALFSFAVLIVPVYVHAIGTWVFVLSGAVAVLVFAGFLRGLAFAGPAPFRPARLRIVGGAAGVFALVNLCYFVNILPPLPLALMASGVYHTIEKSGAVYDATMEDQPWYTRLGWPPVVHVAPGAPVYVFSSVFAPIRLNTQIQHRWEWYSPQQERWLLRGDVAFAVTGGRGGGYRGYTIKHNPAAGDWRVNIETADGKLIGRVRFTIVPTHTPQALHDVVLR